MKIDVYKGFEIFFKFIDIIEIARIAKNLGEAIQAHIRLGYGVIVITNNR